MNSLLQLRPVQMGDHDQIKDLIGCIAGGMTSLPDRSDFLEGRINDSLRAFDHRIKKPAGEGYLFVLEDVNHHRIIGTSGLISRVGGFDPFYTYRIKNKLQEYEPLNVHNNVQILELVKNHKGPSEICSLFLHPQHRHSGIGRLLSLARFCFMKAFPERFDEEIIAELRGYLDEKGRSPFWEAVGKNFFWRDYYKADVLCGVGEKDFIEALMPEFPIYVKLLPISAQAIIGKVHNQTEPARRILLREGFKPTDEIDIFDAGPILKAKRTELLSWKNTHEYTVDPVESLKDNSVRAILTNKELDFRATLTSVHLKGKTVRMTHDAADLLELAKGDIVQCLRQE